MARLFAFDLVFFLLPFALYAAWLLVSRGSLKNLDDWQVKTVSYLAIAGAGLILVVIFAFTSFDQTPANGVYVPAHIQNGLIVPGQIVPPPSGG